MPGIKSHGTLFLLVLLSLVLKSLLFEPIGFWPASFVCMVPWLLLIGLGSRAPRVYFHSFLFGAAFFLINMRWLIPSTGLGYVALALYQAAYFPLVACPIRHAIKRRRLPLALVFPLVWAGSELIRAVFMSGFPWFFLSHGMARVLTMIQVSDLAGAYAVTFVVAAFNGAIADFFLARLAQKQGAPFERPKAAVRGGFILAAVLLVATIIYGRVQLSRETTSPGPKVAVIQGDFLSLLSTANAVGRDKYTDEQRKEAYFSMMRAAAEEENADIYLLPETPWIMYLNREARGLRSFQENRSRIWSLSRESFEDLQRFAAEHQTHVITGSASLEFLPHDLLAKERRYNSASVFYPDRREPGRYDKKHLVYFGEVVPFRFGRLRPVYFWLNRLMPFSGPEGRYEYSLFHGEKFRRFEMEPASQPGEKYDFGIPICYEDVMPYVSRRFTNDGDRKGVDFLLNISNDGWFGRGIQQPQHLSVCVFRAVENRVGIARSVNTGVSAFIDPSGRIHDVVEPDERWPGDCGYSIARIGVDTRYSLYTRWGDWFGWLCAAAWLALFVDYWIARARGLTGPQTDSDKPTGGH